MISVISIREIKGLFHITECEILQEINGHGYCKVKGSLQGSTSINIKAIIDSSEYLTLISDEEDKGNEVIFVGSVTAYDIKHLRDYGELYIELKARTISMDLEENKRVFSKSMLSCTDICHHIDKDQKVMHFLGDLDDNNLEHMSVQYLETDWNYLIRIASEKNSFLVPDYQSSQIIYYFGMPFGSTVSLEQVEYKKKVDFIEYKKKIKAGIDTSLLYETTYVIESEQLFNIGTRVILNLKNELVDDLVVYKIEARLEGAILLFKYYMKRKEGVKTIPNKNYNIIGASMSGRVEVVEGDRVTITTDFDAVQDSTKKFLFATAYAHTGTVGWYCMPEEKDEIMLYFPNENEEEAFVLNAVQIGKMGEEPSVKYFRSPGGSTIEFGPTYLKLESGTNSIVLGDENGITIESGQNISIQADNNVTIKSLGGVLEADAVESINLYQGDARIVVDENVTIVGRQVHVQEAKE